MLRRGILIFAGMALVVGVPHPSNAGPPQIATAHGRVVKVERQRLVLHLHRGDGNRNEVLVLAVERTAKISQVATAEREGQWVLVQEPIELQDVRPRQPITVIYAKSPSGPRLLSAVVEPVRDESLEPGSTPEQKPPLGVPAKVATVLKYIDEHDHPPDDYEGGRTFLNLGKDGEESLPRVDARGRSIRYREWDVNPKIRGRNRGAERLITGSDGSAYYTSDHYRNFTKIR
jgi:guanyl-specific ribonuclease Sa